MGQVISAGILLVVVVAIYIAVSYKHEKSGLGKGCDGNCGSCGSEDLMRNTGDRLKECRIMKGLSRGEMSEMLNVSTDYLARLETGTQPVTYRIIEKVAKLEGWNSDYILHGIDNNNPFSELHTLCPDFRKKVFIRNLLCLFDSMLQFGYKKERVVAYYHRMILEIVNGMELDVPDNVRTGYTLTEIRRIHDMNKKDMANVLGISERSYCTLENGLSRPDVKTLQIVYDMYGFNVQYFLTRNPLDCEAVNNIYRCFDEPLRDFIMRRIRDDYDEIIIMKGRTYGRDI